MEQATLDYYEPIFLEVVKRNPEKFVEIIKPFVDTTNNKRWLTTTELCNAIGTSRKTDTRPYKYKADSLEIIQKLWDERKRGKR